MYVCVCTLAIVVDFYRYTFNNISLLSNLSTIDWWNKDFQK